MEDLELVSTGHNEPTVLAFTDDLFHSESGAKWSLTIRQGATDDDVETLFGLIRLAHVVAVAHGLGFQGRVTAAPQGTMAGDNSFGSQAAEGLVGVTIDTVPASPTGEETSWKRLVDRVEIKGATVEMYVANPNLQNYPILRPAAKVLETVLQKRYGPNATVAYLAKRVSEGMKLVVHWRYSEKLNKEGNPYRDLVDVWTAEDYAATHQAGPEGQEDEDEQPF